MLDKRVNFITFISMKRWRLALLLIGALAAGGGIPAAQGSSGTGAGGGAADPAQPVVLEIRSTPEEAEVFLNYRLVGATPVRIAGLEPGRYRLSLERKGYYPHHAWIDYAGGSQVYEVILQPITGFLQVRVTPADAQISVGSRDFPGGSPVELPVGRYTVKARRFGYEQSSATAEVRERELTTVELDLRKAEFRLSPLRLSRRVFNPRNAAALGRVTVSFEVTSPGAGEARILNRQGQEVHREAFPSFQTWKRSFTWTGTDARGAPLPDGEYRVVVEARPREGGGPQRQEAAVALDSGLVIRSRSLWSGGSGLLFAPSPEVLPPGSLQVSTLAAVQQAGAGGGQFAVPWNLGLRWGLRGGWELDAQAGLTVGSGPGQAVAQDLPPFFASAAVKAPIFRLSGGLELASSLVLKGAWQNTRADPFTNFTGLSAAVPLRVGAGPFSLVLAPEAIVSPRRVAGSPGGEDVFGAWLYGRIGLLVDLGSAWIGLSAALRTGPLDQGLRLALPVPVGLEAHWMIPGTLLTVSGMAAGQFRGPGDYVLQAGGGLGLLF